MELEKYGLVVFNERTNTVSLSVTITTLNDIDKYLKKNKNFSIYISWRDSLLKSHN